MLFDLIVFPKQCQKQQKLKQIGKFKFEKFYSKFGKPNKSFLDYQTNITIMLNPESNRLKKKIFLNWRFFITWFLKKLIFLYAHLFAQSLSTNPQEK